MEREVVLFYKNNYTDKCQEISYYKDFETAKSQALKMIELFKYWGGGNVPIVVIEILCKKRGYKELNREEYPEELYIQYARENGTKYKYKNAN